MRRQTSKALIQRQVADTIDSNTNTQTPIQTPIELLRLAVQQGKDFPIETLERLVALHKDQMAQDAKKAFFDSFSLFQSIAPRLDRISPVDFPTGKGRVKYNFAPLGHIAAVIKDSLRQCGLSYRFKISDTEKGLSVTCIVTHVYGHSEETTMTAPADNSGAKNEIQARGSTVSYLERYTLCSALGLVTADIDNDGREAPAVISAEQAEQIKALINETGSDLQKFLSWGKCTDLNTFPLSKYNEAISLLNKRKK
jgi:hypothetical protein